MRYYLYLKVSHVGNCSYPYPSFIQLSHFKVIVSIYRGGRILFTKSVVAAELQQKVQEVE